MRHGKKSVVCVAHCVAALIPVHRTQILLPDVYRFFDPSGSWYFAPTSCLRCRCWLVDYIVIMTCMVSQSWLISFRQTGWTLTSCKWSLTEIPNGQRHSQEFVNGGTSRGSGGRNSTAAKPRWGSGGEIPRNGKQMRMQTSKISNTGIQKYFRTISVCYCQSIDQQNIFGRLRVTCTYALPPATSLQMDQGSGTHPKGETAFFEPGRQQLHSEPHIRPISCHVASLPWQEPEEELNKLLLTKVSASDRNVKVNIVGLLFSHK